MFLGKINNRKESKMLVVKGKLGSLNMNFSHVKTTNVRNTVIKM